MLSWLQNANPNGIHPLPVPIPLQIMEGSFVRPAVNKTRDTFVVLTQIGSIVEDLLDIEARVVDLGEEINGMEDVLLFLPGKTEKEVWIMTAYRNRQSFEEK